MYSFNILLAIFITGYVLYYGITFIVDRRKAKLLGCQPAHLQRNRLPLGWDLLQRLRAATNAGNLPEEMYKMFQEERHWTFKSSMLGTTFVQTVEPKNIQALLATQFEDFELGDLRRRALSPMLGNGIFTADGKYWKHSRAMIRPQFVRDQVSDLKLEEVHVQELLRQLPTGLDGWTGPINLTPLFFRLTLDSATEFLFGTSVHSQRQQSENHDYEWKNLSASFDTGTRVLGERSQLLEFYWLCNPKDFRDSIKEVHRFADFCVREALDRFQNPKTESAPTSAPKEKYIFLDELVKATKDPIELRSQLLNVLLAGRDTTASLLSWTFWLLARHPLVFDKLRESILSDFGPHEKTEKISFSSLKSCTYLQYVLNEVLRLYPPVPINDRRATKDTTLPLGGGADGKSPIFVKKGEEVLYHVCVMHRMKELWGPDADEFNPERWESRKHGWEYLPFNAGPRICLGQQFALTEAGYVMTRLLQRFDRLRLDKESGMPPAHRLGLTDAPEEYTIYLHEAKLWTEILSVYGPTRETDCLLSIGTGMGSNVADTNILFCALVGAFAPHAQTKRYYRLNVRKELPEPANPKEILGWLTQSKTVEGVPKDVEDRGSLDDVDAIPRLEELTIEWIKKQKLRKLKGVTS
ncbi:cytochrome P450 [Penicillium paradoxum]|uniref:cytochrome P450 n=1 Tax=Penicillium paradoxum TaxID=176176 RepID=UPI0025486E25|nr:cytochrome P450 [Penicillium paradoxum]KAJ5780217.1 cytochrome P450 [Penicillium paradoxum]